MAATVIATGETVYAAGGVEPARAPLTLDLDVDVCVVGGGLAGLTAARELARRGWSVAVLEAGTIGGGASGRNTGFVLPGFASDAETIARRVGIEQARALWRLSEQGADYVRRTIDEAGIAGAGKTEAGWLHVSKVGEGESERFAAFLRERLEADVEHWPRPRVTAALKSPLYFGAVHYPRAFSIDPLAYARGLAAAAEAAGARIFEGTPALEIDPAGVRKRIVTPAARVRASRVVLAGNVGLVRLRPDLAATLIPITTYVIATAPLGGRLRDAIAYRGAVSDTEMANNHYRVVGDERLMWSGRSTTWPRDPTRYRKALLGDIARAYPQLGPVEIAQCWSGTLGNTVHRMPQTGEFAPGLWLAGGFGGHGLNTTAMAGELVARAIAEGDDRWRLFKPFELVWAGGRTGRAAAQAYSWSYARRERIAAWIARRMRPAAPPQSEPAGVAPPLLPQLDEKAPSLVAEMPPEGENALPIAEGPRRPKSKRSKKARKGGPSVAVASTSPLTAGRSGSKSRKTHKTPSVSLESPAPERSSEPPDRRKR